MHVPSIPYSIYQSACSCRKPVAPFSLSCLLHAAWEAVSLGSQLAAYPSCLLKPDQKSIIPFIYLPANCRTLISIFSSVLCKSACLVIPGDTMESFAGLVSPSQGARVLLKLLHPLTTEMFCLQFSWAAGCSHGLWPSGISHSTVVVVGSGWGGAELGMVLFSLMWCRAAPEHRHPWAK